MSIRVFHSDLNPEVDRFSYRVSNSSASDSVDRGEGRLLQLGDGSTILQLYRRRASVQDMWDERLSECLPAAKAVKLPPREIPGVFFRPPQSDRWRMEHRTVTFMPRVAGNTVPAQL